jgi:hypothetical protein
MNTLRDFLTELQELVRIGLAAEGRDYVAIFALGGFIATIGAWAPIIAAAMKGGM